jgi:hypothetical protein
MTRLHGPFSVLFTAVMLFGFTVSVFTTSDKEASGTAKKPLSHLSGTEDSLPSGLTTIEWHQIERQLQVELQEIILRAEDAQEDDEFGWSVAMSGDTVVVGAHEKNGEPGGSLTYAGAAYVFERDNGGPGAWGQAKKLVLSDPWEFDYFGESVAIDGDTIVIGAFEEDGGPDNPLLNAGAAYVFERDQGGPGVWGQVAKLVAADAQAEDNFGKAVSISGNLIIVGAWHEDGGPGDPMTSAGAAYIFDRNQGGNGAWGQVAKLSAGDAQPGDYFGDAVAISNDTVVIGAYGEDGGPGDPTSVTGAAYIFDRNQGGPGAWGQVAKLTDDVPQEYNYFGASVAIRTDNVVVGAYGKNGDDPDEGAAYVYGRNQGGANAWGQVTKLTADDAEISDDFGWSVAISDDAIIVGARHKDDGPDEPWSHAGAAYIFGRNQGGIEVWGQMVKLLASDAGFNDLFGWSVAITTDNVVVGAWGENGGLGSPLPDAGAAYVFDYQIFSFNTFMPVVGKL